MFVFPTSEKEILDIIKCLKNKSTCGHDGVSNLLVKISATVLRPFWLMCLMNSLRKAFSPTV